ncbi:MAG: B12-binding domain-containing radical SAM protein [Candidatus Brocadiaceae bacterium]|nr:B12-binding domain-containing radical SAM protein [Candidatus Brocadiaceae bacterium]
MDPKAKNKILLIEPPFYRLFHDKYSLDKYPLSLGYLAGTIKKCTDWDVMAYNADFNPKSIAKHISYLSGVGFTNYRNNLKHLSASIWNEVKSTILEFKPTVVGITSKTPNFESASIVARIAKEIDDKIIVIIGGPHPSLISSDIINRKEFDVGVRGEGEETIVELLNNIQYKSEWRHIAGIYYRENDEVIDTGQRQLINDVDSLCFPNEFTEQVLKDYKKYPKSAFKYIFAIRGCPYNCWFCGSRYIWSRKARFRSAQNIVEEIKLLGKKGIHSVQFDDDTFGVNRKYIIDLCNHISRYAPETRWSCEMHIKLIEDDLIRLMKESGCESILVGIESGNNEILEKIRKGLTIEEAIEACNVIKRHKIGLGAFFMVGFPWETEETLRDTIDAIKKIKADDTLYSIFMPYPGTEAFEYCKEKGLVSKNFDPSSYNHQSPENCFCLNIEHERFRWLVSKIEEETDIVNFKNRRKYIFNKIKNTSMSEIITKIREFGVLKCIRRLITDFQ